VTIIIVERWHRNDKVVNMDQVEEDFGKPNPNAPAALS
jgi:hypothetical protein